MTVFRLTFYSPALIDDQLSLYFEEQEVAEGFLDMLMETPLSIPLSVKATAVDLISRESVESQRVEFMQQLLPLRAKDGRSYPLKIVHPERGEETL